MWPIDPKQAEYLRKQMEQARPLLEEARRMRPFLEEAQRMRPLLMEAMRNRPSPRELEAMRERARWAAEAAKTIDPATIRALREVSSSGAVLNNVRSLQGLLGPDGLAAAEFLADRRIARRLRAPSAEEGRLREDRVKEVSPERLRRAEELAASPEVRKLLESVDAEELVEEAEAVLEQEGSPEIVAQGAGEVELYGISVEPSGVLLVALILYAALQVASAVAPEQAAAIRQALDDLADVYAVVIAAREFGLAEIPPQAGTAEKENQGSLPPAVRLIDELLAEDPTYDEETWPGIQTALDRDRPSSRKLFAG